MAKHGADLTALESCLQALEHLFIEMQRLNFETRYEEKRGGYGDVRVATLDSGSSTPKLVAVKTIRLKVRDKEAHRLAFRLARELKVWAGLQHPHVLPLLGYYLDKDYKDAVLISEYITNGDLMEYIETEKPSLDLRLHIVRDLTDGLAYLHKQKPSVCHGDLKTKNVLITADRRAMLADFGLSRVLEDAPTGLTTTEGLKGTLRFYSPELMKGKDASHSLASDIWAWGCLVLEVRITGYMFTTHLIRTVNIKVLANKIPYAEKKADRLVLFALVNDEIPAEIGSLPIPIPEIKLLLGKCWAIQPNERPSASYCLRILNSQVYASPTPDHTKGITVQDSIPDQEFWLEDEEMDQYFSDSSERD
ncbi:hypothetical protein FRC01_010981 [Tulasnella sp. 417]|nr:hypothetical protein FRC01_010981 [Tulasnella sp. 417]